MRAVVQRVTLAAVAVDGEEIARIGPGVLALVGVSRDDTEADAAHIADKIAHLRISEDDDGKMNLSVLDTKGEALVVSQFTLYGDARAGRRPSFTDAASGEEARALFDTACERIASLGVPVRRGRFAAHMEVSLVNDGPVTILLDSRKVF